MATAKRKQEELGEECDDQEQHDNECSDDDDAKRPRLELHHQHISHHQLPHHRHVHPEYLVPRTFCKETTDVPFDLSNWQVRSNKYDLSGSKFDQSSSNDREFTNASESSERDQNDLNNTDQNDQSDQPINFAYYHF
ncbi:Benomyl/methotrexate resistance protein [Operophtera brumata]|uniref:Benomyl/methotrexate resistance protein n=1 Tax=Operophtera brumata TaxID=104452 RepID=A0A0L7LD91_OPEBR|nr:Benomyl/methotrexate resistance protein [Operophtera brumata]